MFDWFDFSILGTPDFGWRVWVRAWVLWVLPFVAALLIVERLGVPGDLVNVIAMFGGAAVWFVGAWAIASRARKRADET